MTGATVSEHGKGLTWGGGAHPTHIPNPISSHCTRSTKGSERGLQQSPFRGILRREKNFAIPPPIARSYFGRNWRSAGHGRWEWEILSRGDKGGTREGLLYCASDKRIGGGGMVPMPDGAKGDDGDFVANTDSDAGWRIVDPHHPKSDSGTRNSGPSSSGSRDPRQEDRNGIFEGGSPLPGSTALGRDLRAGSVRCHDCDCFFPPSPSSCSTNTFTLAPAGRLARVRLPLSCESRGHGSCPRFIASLREW